MTYDVYRLIYLICAILSGLCFTLSIVLFFVYKIPKVIGDLTGSNARKAIENIRNQNESTGNKTYKSSSVNKARGRTTDKIQANGTVIQHNPNAYGGAMATSKISTGKLETEALESYETSLLQNGTSNETTVLSESGSGETTVLSETSNNGYDVVDNVFEIEYEIVFVHTNEVIY